MLFAEALSNIRKLCTPRYYLHHINTIKINYLSSTKSPNLRKLDIEIRMSVPPRGGRMCVKVCLKRLAEGHISGGELLHEHCTCASYLVLTLTF